MQILPRLEGGGVERGTLEVAKYLVENNHESLVVSQGGRLTTQLADEGSSHLLCRVASKTPLTVTSVLRLRDLFKRHNPDIVHPRSRLPAWLTYSAIALMPSSSRPRFITSVHGLHSVSRYSSIVGRGELVETVSHTAKEYLLENYPTTCASTVRVIHRGVDEQHFFKDFRPSDEWRVEFDKDRLNSTLPIVLLPGRISRLKGHSFFLRLIEKIAEKGIETQGLIVGDEEKGGKRYLKELQTYAQNSPYLRNHITFLPHRMDLREIMSVADLVVNFSNKPESFGRVVLESLSLGTPVVGFNYGGVGEILNELFPQGLIEPGNLDQAVETSIKLLEQPGSINQHDFTLKRMCSKTVEMYEEVLS